MWKWLHHKRQLSTKRNISVRQKIFEKPSNARFKPVTFWTRSGSGNHNTGALLSSRAKTLFAQCSAVMYKECSSYFIKSTAQGYRRPRFWNSRPWHCMVAPAHNFSTQTSSLSVSRSASNWIDALVPGTSGPVFGRDSALHHFCNPPSVLWLSYHGLFLHEVYYSPQFSVRKARSFTCTFLAERHGVLFGRRENLLKIIVYFNSHSICLADKAEMEMAESEYRLLFCRSTFFQWQTGT
jgi:hypothetical protein